MENTNEKTKNSGIKIEILKAEDLGSMRPIEQEKHQVPRLHEKLWKVCKTLPQDYTPYGEQEREEGDMWFGDCSCGCKYNVPLEGKAGFDWGVCYNPESHRNGLLTFEHQGCRKFEPFPEVEEDVESKENL